jgi:hypothetical protein
VKTFLNSFFKGQTTTVRMRCRITGEIL